MRSWRLYMMLIPGMLYILIFHYFPAYDVQIAFGNYLYVWSTVWQNMGWNLIIYIAALAGIDPELHESAMIDGAGRCRCVLHIEVLTEAWTVRLPLIKAAAG